MFLIRYIPIFFLFAGFAQINNLEVMPELFDKSNVKTMRLNDGEQIELIDTSNLISWWITHKLFNEPAMIKLNEHEYLYNYYAVNNPKLCPQGKHVFNYNDYKKTSDKEKEILKKYMFNAIIDIESSCDGEIIYRIETLPLLGVENLSSDYPIDSRFEALIFNSQGLGTRRMEVNDFLPARCVADLNYSTFSYSSLLPKSYNAFLIELSRKLLMKTVNNNVSEKNIKATLLFDHNGNNVSKVFGIKENNLFQAQLKNELLAFKKYAFYDGIKVSTQDDLVIEFRDENKNKVESIKFCCTSLIYTWFNENPTLQSFNFCKKYLNLTEIQDLLTAEIKPFPYSVWINNEKLSTEKKYITHLNLAGPLSPLTSLIYPGFGSNRLNLTRSSKIHSTLATITIATFIASFVLSKSYYRKYLDNIETDPFYESNFNTANTFHKIAIGSMIFYPVLSLSDIVTCYANKLNLFGNKKIQRKMNDELKENSKKGIYLCN